MIACEFVIHCILKLTRFVWGGVGEAGNFPFFPENLFVFFPYYSFQKGKLTAFLPTKFNSKQFLFEAFSDVTRIFGSV